MGATLPGISVTLDPGTVAAIKNIINFKSALSSRMYPAMETNKNILVISAQDMMNWQNPTGALYQSFAKNSKVFGSATGQGKLPYAIVGSRLPYAARREFGFDGPDSLGRVYHDPGAFYLTRAVGATSTQIQQNIMQVIADTWNSPTSTP